MPLLIPFPLVVNTFGEEYGWRGYLTPRLAKRLGWVKASVVTGILWGFGTPPCSC
ncbi:CPBP family intramembrane glutamic endopeptidase [Pyrobaculum aerophilum]|uniref:CPBP family intramembrane glutamic endopeptidase n=1 Tax=Pyrobaculum aerophilum TaxID=13773 RepID=UPI0023F4046C|nr:CPBP family intramembrane glutamic endopeptidase [Pyrobaculum aerophilum]MCX8136747.1 CPBP family intramembrane metalloprotease [Pyrobaculum aerophilum]